MLCRNSGQELQNQLGSFGLVEEEISWIPGGDRDNNGNNGTFPAPLSPLIRAHWFLFCAIISLKVRSATAKISCIGHQNCVLDVDNEDNEARIRGGCEWEFFKYFCTMSGLYMGSSTKGLMLTKMVPVHV